MPCSRGIPKQEGIVKKPVCFFPGRHCCIRCISVAGQQQLQCRWKNKFRDSWLNGELNLLGV